MFKTEDLAKPKRLNATEPPVSSPSIYVVDDEPRVTDLYDVVLRQAGYSVRTFNSRAAALDALRTREARPDLLITDYCGLSMRVDRFIYRCLMVFPGMPILMASGYSPADMRLFQPKSECFIRKPFTSEEFRSKVKCALTAGSPCRRMSR